MTEFSCYGCEMRRAGCHATCEIYKAEKAVHEARRKEERKQRNIEIGLTAHAMDTISRHRKKQGKRWNGRERGYTE
jgi:hypothetical protein